MKEVNNDKRVLQVEIDNNVKKVAITGVDADDKVVMRQELNENDLDQVAGGAYLVSIPKIQAPKICNSLKI